MASGLLLIDKPVGPTSRHVLDGLERRLGLGPLGHAGTLDPAASGLLVALVGRFRKLQERFLGSDKCYEALVRFGEVSETLDREGPIAPGPRAVPADLESVLRSIRPRFEGVFDQMPPAHSALHVAGRRAHRIARGGETPRLAPRRVDVKRLELLGTGAEEARFLVRAAAGFYVRSLARDLGEAVGCGAWLAALRRTASGELRVEEALPPDEIGVEHLLPPEKVLSDRPRRDVDEEAARRLAHGQPVVLSPPLPPDTEEAFAWHAGRVLCRLKALPEGRGRSNLLLSEAPAS